MIPRMTTFLLLTSSLLVGCATSSSPSERILLVDTPLPPPASNPDDLTPPQQARDPIHFDIESFNGDVVIVANPKLKEMRVSLERDAVHGWGRRDEAKKSLDLISSDVQTIDDERGRTIRIRTSTTHPEPYFQRANLHIEAPAVGDVRVQTSRGKIYVTDNQGEMDLQTSHDDVRVMTHWPITAPVTILTSNGDVDYRIRAESTGRFDCLSLGGKVFFRQRYGRWSMQDPGTTHDRVVAVLNEGENPITLRTVDGKIRVAVVSDPTAVGTYIVDP
jgi:hypothetical protein